MSKRKKPENAHLFRPIQQPHPHRQTLYRHSPTDDSFMNLDALVETMPVPGMAFHRDPGLAEWVQKHGAAPDKLFSQGLAAPPLGDNHSGLRHYEARLHADPQRVMNLDVPLEGQTKQVRDALAKMGIRSGESYIGEPLPMKTLLWEAALSDSPEMLSGLTYGRAADPLDRERIARNLSEVANAGSDEAAIRNVVAPQMLNMLNDAGIPAATGQAGGWPVNWHAGAVYAPEFQGREPGYTHGGIRVFRPGDLQLIRKFAVPGAVAAGAASQQSDPTDIRSSLLTP